MIVITQQVFCGEVELVETIQFETIEECLIYWAHINEKEE